MIVVVVVARGPLEDGDLIGMTADELVPPPPNMLVRVAAQLCLWVGVLQVRLVWFGFWVKPWKKQQPQPGIIMGRAGGWLALGSSDVVGSMETSLGCGQLAEAGPFSSQEMGLHQGRGAQRGCHLVPIMEGLGVEARALKGRSNCYDFGQL
jgi:hypothetical protein